MREEEKGKESIEDSLVIPSIALSLQSKLLTTNLFVKRISFAFKTKGVNYSVSHKDIGTYD